MHEMTLVSSIIDIVNSYKNQYKFKKVNSLKLSFGQLSCVNQDSLTFAFDALSEDTVLKNCKLIFEIIPPKITCNNCNKESIVTDDFSKCTYCGSNDIYLSGGMEELKILELDVEDE